MPRFPALGSDSPIARWVTSAGRGRLGPRGARIATFGVLLALALAVVGALLAMQVSSTPRFCGSCHIMAPYFASWKNSKHNQVACVECHIAPGITAELLKKYEALSMVVKYFTGTYGTNPWAEVDDAACLRCHERRLLEGKEVFHGVLFDHTPHLTELRRGLKLRCTSCHSQIVQGSHIAVTAATCALCHFKGQEVNQGTARCRLCHEIPERVVSAAGAPFDHSQVRRLDMDCSLCHGGVVRGQGAVPRERCLTCHNEPERLAQYGRTDFLHRMHVSTHKVDCMNCHLEIEHGRPAASAPPPGGACESCHGAGHSSQASLYAGLGGRGVPRMPSPMFTAGVKCEGCHNLEFTAGPEGEATSDPARAMVAGEVSCMACHGPGYLRIYRAWKEGVAARTAALRSQFEISARAMGEPPPEPWIDARQNFLLVERGHGVHNVNFAFALLEKAQEQMNDARRRRGLPPLPRPWPSVPAGGAPCFACHQGVERQAGAWAGRVFAHGPHLLAGRLECAACHRPHGERAPGEVVRFGEQGCVPCHHRGAQVAAAACARCHGDVTRHTVKSFRGEFSHKAHLENGLECGSCHGAKNGDPRPAASACGRCHEDG